MHRLVVPGTLLLLAITNFSAHAQISDSEPDLESDQAVCLSKRTDSVFSDFEHKQEEWAARYQFRKAEFRPQVLENANALSRCVERARRRDLRTNSETTFGIQVSPDGHVARIAVLQANHADNLYGACLARTLCTFTLTSSQKGESEIFTLSFNMRRKPKPHERPWSLDPAR
jgi:hypothetical protein